MEDRLNGKGGGDLEVKDKCKDKGDLKGKGKE